MQASTVSRRGFIGLGAAAAAGVAALAAQPSVARAGLASDATGLVPSFFTAPEPPADVDVAETIDVDVCVVGVGLAGVCALREAAEQGQQRRAGQKTRQRGVEKETERRKESGAVLQP